MTIIGANTMNMEGKEIKYFIYIRKSTEDEDRQVLSLDSQEKTLKDLALNHNLNVIAVFRESHSAKAPGVRPIFAGMIKRIKNGEARGIICWKLDRLARNPDEAGMLMGMLQRKEVLNIKTPEKEYRPEDNSILSYLEFGIANQYIRDLSNNVKRGLKTKLEMGWFPSRAPLGYLNSVTREKGNNEIEKDPLRFEQVKQLWELMLSQNYTVSQILKIATKKWGLKTRNTKKVAAKPLGLSMLYRIFSNPFYYGWFEYPKGSENWFQGKHDPMITEAEYNQVQAMIGRCAGKPRSKIHNFAFTGIMTCGGCGAAVTAEEKWKRNKNGNVHYYIYYHCTKRVDKNCDEKYVEQKEIEKQIDFVLSKFEISEQFKTWAIRFLDEPRQNQSNQKEESLVQNQKRIEEIGKQLESLFTKYTAPANIGGELISDEEYKTTRIKLQKEKFATEEQMNAGDQKVAEMTKLSAETFNFACYARKKFQYGDEDTKRAIFKALGSNFILKDQAINFDLHLPLKITAEKKELVENELKTVRTYDYLINTKQIFSFANRIPILRGQ